MGFTLVIHTTMGFYNTFFPIYYKNMGADNTILGWRCLSARRVKYLPCFRRQDNKRLGIKFTLFGAAVVAVVRWASLGLINNIFAVLALQILHGFIFIVLAYSMATYINNEMHLN